MSHKQYDQGNQEIILSDDFKVVDNTVLCTSETSSRNRERHFFFSSLAAVSSPLPGWKWIRGQRKSWMESEVFCNFFRPIEKEMIVKQNLEDKCLSRVERAHVRGEHGEGESCFCCLHRGRGGVPLPALALQCQWGLYYWLYKWISHARNYLTAWLCRFILLQAESN